jgi:hypothetical protein
MRSLAALAALVPLEVQAEEAWLCEIEKECSSVSKDCTFTQGTFPVRIVQDGTVLEMPTPNRGLLSMTLAKDIASERAFSGTAPDLTYSVTLTAAGGFTGLLSETMFFGGVVEHTLTASCKRETP